MNAGVDSFRVGTVSSFHRNGFSILASWTCIFLQTCFFRKLPSGKLRQPWKISVFLGKHHENMVDFTFSAMFVFRKGIQKFSGKDVQDYMEFQSDTESQSRSSGKSGTRSDRFFFEGSFFPFLEGEKLTHLCGKSTVIYYSMQHIYIYIDTAGFYVNKFLGCFFCLHFFGTSLLAGGILYQQSTTSWYGMGME